MIIIKNKIPFIGILALAGIVSIGSTFAYFYTETDVKNFFSVSPYDTISYENFESPNDWKPSTITTKEVFAKNLGENDVIARISYTETWTSKNGKILPNKVTYFNGKWLSSKGEDYSNMISNSINPKNGDVFEFAIKHFENSDWVYGDDGYYYYQKVLHKNDTSTAFLGAVEFNGLVDDTSIGVNSNGEYDSNLYINGEYVGYFDGNSHIYSYASSNDGYFNAKYCLDVTIEFTDASTNSMEDIFKYDINSKSNGAESLYNLLLND